MALLYLQQNDGVTRLERVIAPLHNNRLLRWRYIDPHRYHRRSHGPPFVIPAHDMLFALYSPHSPLRPSRHSGLFSSPRRGSQKCRRVIVFLIICKGMECTKQCCDDLPRMSVGGEGAFLSHLQLGCFSSPSSPYNIYISKYSGIGEGSVAKVTRCCCARMTFNWEKKAIGAADWIVRGESQFTVWEEKVYPGKLLGRRVL